MGALHAGHRELLRTARRLPNTVLAASIFVNPLQFGAARTSTATRGRWSGISRCAGDGARRAGVHADAGRHVPGGAEVTVHPGPLGDELEGAARPGHFAGVLTVVAKLFNIVRPDYAVFGEKDYQQLDAGQEDGARPGPRGQDGRRADGARRRTGSRCPRATPTSTTTSGDAAVTLSAALDRGRAGQRGRPDAVLDAARAVLDEEPRVDVDYLELRGNDLGPAPVDGEARLLVAARVGRRACIDNVPGAPRRRGGRPTCSARCSSPRSTGPPSPRPTCTTSAR